MNDHSGSNEKSAMRWQMALLWLSLSIFTFSCSFLKHGAVHGLNDGYYLQKDQRNVSRKVYAEVTEDSITVYPIIASHSRQVDTKAGNSYPLKSTNTSSNNMGMLMKTSVDIDLISVLFKYHFSTPTIPNQFSETFNAAVHAGVRKDFFHFRNHRTPLQTNLQHMNHFEIDGGVFAGLGTTLINPSVTENNLAVEYDGLVLQKGVAAFIGVQNFTIGVGWGSDQLLDKNHTYWIYSGKTWLGVIIGLKLSK